MLIFIHGCAYRRRCVKAFFLQELVSFNEPIQNGALIFRFEELSLQRMILLVFLKVPLERNDHNAIAQEHRHIIDDRLMVGVNEHLESRLEIETLFVEKTGRDRIVTGHGFNQ